MTINVRSSRPSRWLTVVFFAIAMAWVEAAVVYYLRTMVDRIDPYQPEPLPRIGFLGPVELARELATLVMLFTVGVLAGKTWRTRLGFTAIAFGIWDIFYYIFLKLMCGWPQSLMDWDILFLLPLPWWGPVLAPVLIALLMIAWGTLATQFASKPALFRTNVTAWGIALIGMGLALYIFMADTLRVADQGVDVIRNVLPDPNRFPWAMFVVALGLMTAPAIELARRTWTSRGKPDATAGLPAGPRGEQT